MSQQEASKAQMSLKERILAYYKAHPGQWIASGDIQRMVTEKTTYTAANATRRLRELAEDGELEVEYRKNHAYYRRKAHLEQRRRVQVIDGRAVEIIENVTV